MRINRLYLEQHISAQQEVPLDTDAAHHLTRVLRLRAGADLRVFDGHGREFHATLLQAGRKGGRLRIAEACEAVSESPLQITLAQGISRGDRMDLVVQKATELGVHRISPVMTERSVVRLDEQRRQRRSDHWRRIMINACEQCGRATLPRLDEAAQFDNWLASLDGPSARLVLHPGARRRVSAAEKPADGKLLVVIGPEGGFSSRERSVLEDRGFVAVSLGPRILRTETAALAALAVLQSVCGDL